MIRNLNYCSMNCLCMIYHRFQGRFQGIPGHFALKVNKKSFFPCRPGHPSKAICFVPCAQFPYVWLLEALILKFPEIWEQKLFFRALPWEIHFPQHLYRDPRLRSQHQQEIATNASCGQYASLICVFLLAPTAKTAWILVSIRWWMISEWNSRGPWSQSPGNVFPANVPVSWPPLKRVRGIHIPKLDLTFIYNKHFDICWQPVRFLVQWTHDFRIDKFSADVLGSLLGYQNQAGAISHKRKRRFLICFCIHSHSNHVALSNFGFYSFLIFLLRGMRGIARRVPHRRISIGPLTLSA